MNPRHIGTFAFLGQTGGTGSTANFGITNPQTWGTSAPAASAPATVSPSGTNSAATQSLSMTQWLVIGGALTLAAIVLLMPSGHGKR